MTQGSKSAWKSSTTLLRPSRRTASGKEQYRDNPRVEVVLLGAESIDAIKVTHSNYFEETVDAFAGLAARLGLSEHWRERLPA